MRDRTTVKPRTCVRHADWRIEDGVRIRRQGLTHKLTAVLEEHQRLKRPPKYVAKLQAEFMETVNASIERPEMCSTITQFVEENWLPFIREQDSTSTVTTYTYYWTHLLKPRCGSNLVRDYTTPQAEQMLHEIGLIIPICGRLRCTSFAASSPGSLSAR
jgi:hypothetical protein